VLDTSAYSHFKRGHEDAGSSVPTNDIWIAAMSARATVLTFDDHFRKIARVGTHIFDLAT
jgi:predicted nucleic acid-binding protein